MRLRDRSRPDCGRRLNDYSLSIADVGFHRAAPLPLSEPRRTPRRRACDLTRDDLGKVSRGPFLFFSFFHHLYICPVSLIPFPTPPDGCCCLRVQRIFLSPLPWSLQTLSPSLSLSRSPSAKCATLPSKLRSCALFRLCSRRPGDWCCVSQPGSGFGQEG
jgi:hypothetical protein